MADKMHDRGNFWRPVPAPTDVMQAPGFEARFIAGLSQTLVTGNLDAARAGLVPGAPEVGLWGLATDREYWVSIARDRALLVSPTPLQVAPGWRDGYVATPCADAYAILDLSGDDLPQVIAEATSADLEAGSRSAAVLFAGVPAFLYRTAPSTGRLHVESPLAAYLWTWLAERR